MNYSQFSSVLDLVLIRNFSQSQIWYRTVKDGITDLCGDAAKGSLDPAEYLDIYQCAAKSAAAEKSVLRRKLCVVVLFLTMLPL